MNWLTTPNQYLPNNETPRRILEDFIDPNQIDNWLDSPNTNYGCQTPRNISQTNPQLLLDDILRMIHGIFS